MQAHGGKKVDDVFDMEDQQELFQVEATITEEAIRRFESQEALIPKGAGVEIRTLLRDASHIIVGQPIVFPLAKLLKARGETLPAEIRLQNKDYEFHLIQLSCTLDAAAGCRFHEARFEFDLRNQDATA